MTKQVFDVAIIGGGPGGSTCGGFLKKYRPDLSVGIFEREVFPRDHVGESQLPLVCKILDELGAWDKVEEAGFPVKIGATYRWGSSDDLWDFNFLPGGVFGEEQRPAKFEGQRTLTAFQVDRSVYDKILLDHARELGCTVTEAATVREVRRTGDRVDGLTLADGTEIEAKYYVDASGHSGILRRAMQVQVEEPSTLKNIAVWDYWQNAEWAVTLGVGGTRIQIMSLGYGWMWFIPLSPTRTSIGLVCPADYYKNCGMKPEELYLKAIQDEPRIRTLVQNGTREHNFATTKDWSFVAERMTGQNWFLVGESGGFADPILSAGLSLTHAAAREAAFTILEMGKGRDAWLLKQYSERNRRKVFQHIRFADYWYTANAHFDELKEFTRDIAKDAGLELDANAAFQWLGTGGFVEEDMSVGGLALFSLDSLHHIARRLSNSPTTSPIDGYSGFILNLRDAEQIELAYYDSGRVMPIQAYRRNGKILPLVGFFGWLVAGLQHSPTMELAAQFISARLREVGLQYDAMVHTRLVQSLEAMVRDGWVKPKKFANAAPLTVAFEEGGLVEDNHDESLPAERLASGLRVH